MRRAVGIVRVSERGEREGESFRSPTEQRQRIEAACTRDNLALVDIHEELDVSGGMPLNRRHGLLAAVQAIEAGEADVLTVAYFDRLVRSLKVQDEVVSRVEAAGGKVLALDVGEVTGATAAQWLSGTTLGMMSEYYRRSIGERVAGTQALAVAKGVWPSRVPIGYSQGKDGVLVPSAFAPVVRDGFQLRAEGKSIGVVRALLRDNGVDRCYAAVEKMFRSRTYLGEIHFGELVNLTAHEALVDVETWRRAQRVRVPRGRQAPSNRLLARLGVLRCGVCDARMSVGGRPMYPVYRCNQPDCSGSPSISARVAEGVVVKAVRAVLADVVGIASAEREALDAAAAADAAQADLDAAIRAFTGLEGEDAAAHRLAELREARDIALAEAHRLGRLHLAYRLPVAERWDDISDEGKRGLIRAIVDRALVAPGRSTDRITLKLLP